LEKFMLAWMKRKFSRQEKDAPTERRVGIYAYETIGFTSPDTKDCPVCRIDHDDGTAVMLDREEITIGMRVMVLLSDDRHGRGTGLWGTIVRWGYLKLEVMGTECPLRYDEGAGCWLCTLPI